ncbi:hypothetical protein [Bartonella tamiae]|uniref:Uncharacterized protein n=1 Tax=Bartonella tamiae Th239 TaxID=1094558 RepID=J0QZJ6_9HYPH|nr:hypothetical protein [Bartonella tamiae]EJF88664.1 hypothetical protein ME5_01215 [Bartonella tamiae Th239]EJF95086.1 hypothetical protein MEG_00667 [Bartonella tamiae Th307]
MICIGDLGIEVGSLWFEANSARQHSTYQYSQSWLNNPRCFAIAPSIALLENRFFFKADDEVSSPLPPPLADASPDSWGGQNIIRGQARALLLIIESSERQSKLPNIHKKGPVFFSGSFFQ